MCTRLVVARQEHVRERRAAADVLQQLRHGVPAIGRHDQDSERRLMSILLGSHS